MVIASFLAVFMKAPMKLKVGVLLRVERYMHPQHTMMLIILEGHMILRSASEGLTYRRNLEP